MFGWILRLCRSRLGNRSWITWRCLKSGRKKRSGSCAGVSYGNNLNINFSRKIVEHGFEDAFVRIMEDMGIRADIKESVPSRRKRTDDTIPVNPMQWARVARLRTLLLI